MSVSIVVATKDRVEVLPRALASARREGPGAEVIVVAAEASDSVRSAGRRFGADVIGGIDTGLAAAWNLGLERTSGDVVVFLNDDDVLLPGALQDVEAHGAAGVVGRAVTMGDGRCRSVPDDGRLSLELVLLGPLNFNARFWQRAALEDLGPFDPTFRLAVDRELALRAHRRGYRFRPLGRPVYAYLEDAGSRTFTPDRAGLMTMHEEQLRLLDSVASGDRGIVRRATAISDLWLAIEMSRAGHRRQYVAAIRAASRRWRDAGPLLGWFLWHHRRRRPFAPMEVDCGPVAGAVDPQGWMATP